jgi:predicted transposase YbfD/YdcC
MTALTAPSSAVRSLVDCFSRIEDPRVERTQIHDLTDIIILSVLAVIAGAEGWEDIREYGVNKEAFLRKFLNLRNGIPSEDTTSRVMRMLRPNVVQDAFMDWVNEMQGNIAVKRIAIDGKSLRRSHDRSTARKMLHCVCAWSVENQLVLGEQAVDEKSNEITAIPKLLDALELDGAIVTIDAMGCQKEIAAKIIDRGGDYVLGAKDNHPTLCDGIAAYFTAAHEEDFKGHEVRKHTTHENCTLGDRLIEIRN